MRSEEPKMLFFYFFRILAVKSKIGPRAAQAKVAKDQNPLGHKFFSGNGFKPCHVGLDPRECLFSLFLVIELNDIIT